MTDFKGEHIMGIWAKALFSQKGIEIEFKSESHAIAFRHRLNSARVKDRLASKRIYTPDEPMYGKSSYDNLGTRVVEGKDGKWIVVICPLECMPSNLVIREIE